MSDHHVFRNQQSSDFWEECEAEIPSPYLEIVMEILCSLNALGSTTSVRSEYSSRGEYAFQGKTSLLDHSIHVARICLSQSELSIVRNLAVIAGLGHDLGKLSLVCQGKYTAIMHAYYGAEYVSRIIGERLIEQQAEAVVSAIRGHNIAGKGAVHRVLREADSLARSREFLGALDRIVEAKGARR